MTPKLPSGFELIEVAAKPSIELPPGFEMVEDEPASAPGAAVDVGKQAVYGFNKGLNDLAALPGAVMGWGLDKLGFDDAADAVRWNNPVSDFLTEEGERNQPETTAGRYAKRAGEMAGASALPGMGMVAAAPRMAAMAPTTTSRAVGQSMGQQITAAPGTAAVLDAASAASSGIAAEAAKDGGLGPVGQGIATMAGGMVPGIATAYLRPGGGRIGTETGEGIATQRAAGAAEDLAAHEAAGIRPFGPSFNQGPVASVGQQLTETPLIGAPLRNNLDETYTDAASATARLADEISPNATHESAGISAQRGLVRFRTSGLEDMDAARLLEIGVDPMAPQPRGVGMSAGAMREAAQAQPVREALGGFETVTTQGVPVPAARSLSETVMRRARAENLNDADLSRVIRAPAQQTSFGARSEALYERAWRMLPEMMRSNGTRNPNVIAAANTRVALSGIDANIASSITSQSTLNGALAQRLRSASSANFPLSDLRAIRTEVGRAMSKGIDLDHSLDKTQLRQLYSALSRDIEVGIETLANRAALRTRSRGGDRVDSEAARRAGGALRAMRTADRYFRQGMERMDRFNSVLQSGSPEQAAQKLVRAAADGGKGNIRMFRSAMSALRPEERSEFGSLVLREMGRPTAGARGIVQEADWSPSKFVTSYRAMAPEARRLVFSPEQQRSLDSLFQVANRIANVEALANTSRSGTNAMNVGGSAAAIASGASGDLLTPLMIGGSGLAASLLMSTPQYARWLTRYITLRAHVRSGADRAIAPLLRHVAGLENHAQMNPMIVPAYIAVMEETQELTSDAGNTAAGVEAR